MWGPLSTALAFYMIPKGSPYRYVTQFGVSLGQLYVSVHVILPFDNPH